jgi:hypothetical protein
MMGTKIRMGTSIVSEESETNLVAAKCQFGKGGMTSGRDLAAEREEIDAREEMQRGVIPLGAKKADRDQQLEKRAVASIEADQSLDLDQHLRIEVQGTPVPDLGLGPE